MPKIEVRVYDIVNNTHSFYVDTMEKAREYAKRITTEGLWLKEADGEVFYPVSFVFKVKIREGMGE